MRHIKRDPNPRGQENFLFVNELNEWGEGNVLEPSIQWGSRFSKAFRAAKDYADTALPWMDDNSSRGGARARSHGRNKPGRRLHYHSRFLGREPLVRSVATARHALVSPGTTQSAVARTGRARR